METKIKKYKVNKIEQILSLGLSRNGMKIENQILNKEIPVSQIQSIEYCWKTTNSKGVIAYSYEFTYTYKGRNIPTTDSYLVATLSARSWQELIKDLLQINPNIKISFELERFINQEVFEPYQWKFNFEKNVENNDKEIEKKGLIVQKYTYLPMLEAWVSLFLIIPIMMIPFGLGFWGDYYFSTTIAREYSIYKNILLIIGSIFLSFSILNLLSALYSTYLGHKTTIISTILGVVCTILAFVL